MLESLQRLALLERRIDRWLPPEPAPGQLSTDSVLTEYAEDPVGFARDLLGYELEFELPDGERCTYQADIARAVLAHSKVAVRSSHKLGKSLVAVLLAIWWVVTRADSRAVLTAASDRQVRRVLWRELRKMHRRLVKRGIELMPQARLDPATGCQWPDGREIIGFATKLPENAAGFSEANLFFVLDEGSGIPTEIYEAFAGNMAGGAKMLSLSNPTQTSGWFYEAFNVRREFWHTMHLSCQDSPNFRAGKTIVPGLATREYEAEIAAAYGVDSPFYQVRVGGNFPLQVSNAVIGLGLVEAARARWDEEAKTTGVLELGVDVARFGDDDSAVAARRGLKLYTPDWLERRFRSADLRAVVHGYDSKAVAGVVIRVMRALRVPGERVVIKLDAGGGYGGGVADELRAQQEAGELDAAVEIIEVNVAVSSKEPEKYPQLRDELWFNLRWFLHDGGMMAGDARLEAEMIAPLYTMTRLGQFKVESKDDIKARLGRSPDRADAVCLAVYDAGGAVPTYEPRTARTATDLGGF